LLAKYSNIKGKFSDLISFDVDSFVSLIPSQLGYPELPSKNIAEGIVLKLLKNKYVKSGRVIVKHKSESFKEVTGVYNTKPRQPSPIILPQFPEELENFWNNLTRYVTENRLRNVLSKVGAVQSKDMSKIVGLLAKDALEDFSSDFPKWKELKKEEQKKVTSKLSPLVVNLVYSHWKEIVKGNF